MIYVLLVIEMENKENPKNKASELNIYTRIKAELIKPKKYAGEEFPTWIDDHEVIFDDKHKSIEFRNMKQEIIFKGFDTMTINTYVDDYDTGYYNGQILIHSESFYNLGNETISEICNIIYDKIQGKEN